MSTNFGKGQEVGDSVARKLYTGVENFKVIAVNPTKEELAKIYGRDITFDLEYINETEVKDGAGDRKVPQVRLDFYLSNEEGVNVKASFYVAKTFHQSATNKFKVVNDFGRTTWLTKEAIDSGSVPENMHWYNSSGLKVAKRGEEEVLSFIINLLNIPYDLTKVADVSEAYARIPEADWEKIFAGDFSILRAAIESTNNKIGMLLGVKTKADGGLVQAVFNRHTLRQYVLPQNKATKFQYLLKDLAEAKANNAFGNVDFAEITDPSLTLREHVIVADQLKMELAPSDAFGDLNVSDSQSSEPDDLPF
jgi:hypothetical protein